MNRRIKRIATMTKTTATESPKPDAAVKGVEVPKRDMPEAPKKAKATWTSNPNVADPTPVPDDGGKK